MSRGRGPSRRLLLVPVVLFVALFVAVTAIEAASPRTVDPALRIAVPDPGAQPDPALDRATDDPECSRDGDPQVVADVRAALTDRPHVSSTMVLSCPAAFDGMTVQYTGELVGDLLRRRGGAWVLVNDDDYALEVGPLPAHGALRGLNSGLTVWLPERLVSEVTGVGRPDRRGDVFAFEGRIERADGQDGGGLTLRVTEARLLAASQATDAPLDVPQLLFAGALTLVAGSLWVLRRRATTW